MGGRKVVEISKEFVKVDMFFYKTVFEARILDLALLIN